MPKAVALTPDALTIPQRSSRKAGLPRITEPTTAVAPKAAPVESSLAKRDQVPLQLRIPRLEAKRIKVAAAEAEETISDFMLACFHAYMKNSKA